MASVSRESDPPRRDPASAEDRAWHDVAGWEDLPPDGEGRTVEVGSKALALFRVGDRVHAVSDTCPHAGASLGAGVIVDGEVACPWHSFHFDLESGRNTDGLACRIQVYPVRRTSEGRVEVGLPL